MPNDPNSVVRRSEFVRKKKKKLDPNSVVRKSEFARKSGDPNSVVRKSDQFKRMFSK